MSVEVVETERIPIEPIDIISDNEEGQGEEEGPGQEEDHINLDFDSIVDPNATTDIEEDLAKLS